MKKLSVWKKTGQNLMSKQEKTKFKEPKTEEFYKNKRRDKRLRDLKKNKRFS